LEPGPATRLRGASPHLSRSKAWFSRPCGLPSVPSWHTVIGVLWTPQIGRFPTLWQYLQSILSYITPPVVAVFLLGLLWPRANAAGALAGLAAGFPIGLLAWIVIELLGLFELQYLYAAIVMLGVGLVLVIGASLATDSAPADGRGLWRPGDASMRPAGKWYADYRMQAAALLATTAVLVIRWW